MRARGAEATDIVVLVVAADDGVMPQTIEAINHAKAAEVPIVVAINKVDREDADPQRVMQQLSEHGPHPRGSGAATRSWSRCRRCRTWASTTCSSNSLLVADVEELTANPEGRAKGVVLEANLDIGRGPVATVLVDRGHACKVGDPIVAGAAWGRCAPSSTTRASRSRRPARRRRCRCSVCPTCPTPATSSVSHPTSARPRPSPRPASTGIASASHGRDARVMLGGASSRTSSSRSRRARRPR